MFTVLYVDDEPGLLEVAKLFLEQGGQFTVDTITSAPAALALMNTKSYDAIIADYQMPVMDGIEFLKKVRGSGNTIPFILFTGKGREEIVIQALNEGADFYLQKGGAPVAQFTELAHQVRQAVQQRRAEISIRDLERREADIINFLPDATFAIDRSGHIIAWNHAIEEMTGVSAAAMLGKGDYEYAVPFYGIRRKILIDLVFGPDEDLTQLYAHIIRERDTLIAISDLPRPKGRNATLYGKAGPLYNRQGEIIGAIQSIRDITEMKKAEEEVRAANEQLAASAEVLRSQYDELAESEKRIRESEARFRSIFESSPYPIAISNPRTGTYILANAAFQRISGYPEEEIIGKDAIELGIMAPEDLERRNAFYQSQKNVESELFTIIKKGGDTKSSVLISFIPITINCQPAVLTMAVDITERKQAEEALRESENTFITAFKSSPLAMIITSAHDSTIVDVNDVFLKDSGFTREEVIGHVTDELGVFVDFADHKRLLSVVHSQDYAYGMEMKFRIKSKKILTCLISSRLITIHGQPHILSTLEDITERKRAEEALRESEAKYRLLADTSPEMIYLVDPEGCIQYVNTSSARAFRTTPEDLVGKHIADLFPPDVARHHLESIRKVISTRQPVLHDITDVLPSGEIWIEVRLSPVIDHENRVIGVLGLSNDITQRKRAEEALRQSEVRFRTIFENQQNGLIMVDAETHVIVDANRTALALFGATSEDVTGRVCHTFVCPAEEGKCPVTDLGQTVDMSERVLLNKKGERIPVIKSVSRITLGDRTFLIESFADITDQKRAEEALRASEEKYRGIFENTTVAVFQTRIDGSIAAANPAFARLLKYETPEMAIREIPNIRAIYVNPDLRDKLYQILVTKGAVEDFEFALRRRDGSTLWASVNVRAVYGNDGKISGLEGLAVDITERKKTEEALRDINKKLNLLSKITRHDINNQLMLLQGYLKMMEKKQPDPSFNLYFQKVVNAAQRISSMIQFTNEYEEIGINAPVWQDCHILADMAATPFQPGGVLVKNDLPSGTEVFADPLIVRVFYNLMDNAIRYGRKITTIRFSLQESGDDHLIVCEDDGDGVPAAEKERIFERGFGKNTGLGLFLSREILGITGITIRENGIPGKGARFEMAVPKNAYRFTGTEQVKTPVTPEVSRS